MAARIAILGAACEFPDAPTPHALWQNVLSKRRAFRRMPAERLQLADYARNGGDDPDGIYEIEVALIEGYRFDRGKYLTPEATFQSTDLSHWLALDVADRAIATVGSL